VSLPATAEDAVAVVGLSCRLPQAPDPDSFWQLLRAGRDALTPPPACRDDPAAPGKAGAGRGGFLDRVGHFDPAFFGISPREAAAMDPRQRLMLEPSLAWARSGADPAEAQHIGVAGPRRKPAS
jgi:acyl transferase domain-containing protein